MMELYCEYWMVGSEFLIQRDDLSFIYGWDRLTDFVETSPEICDAHWVLWLNGESSS